MENRKRIITTFCLNCDILIDLICPIHHAAPDRERERALLFFGKSQIPEIKRARFIASVPVWPEFIHFWISKPLSRRLGGIRPSDNLGPD